MNRTLYPQRRSRRIHPGYLERLAPTARACPPQGFLPWPCQCEPRSARDFSRPFPSASVLSLPFLFIDLRVALPETPSFSHSSALPGARSHPRPTNHYPLPSSDSSLQFPDTCALFVHAKQLESCVFNSLRTLFANTGGATLHKEGLCPLGVYTGVAPASLPECSCNEGRAIAVTEVAGSPREDD